MLPRRAHLGCSLLVRRGLGFNSSILPISQEALHLFVLRKLLRDLNKIGSVVLIQLYHRIDSGDEQIIVIEMLVGKEPFQGFQIIHIDSPVLVVHRLGRLGVADLQHREPQTEHIILPNVDRSPKLPSNHILELLRPGEVASPCQNLLLLRALRISQIREIFHKSVPIRRIHCYVVRGDVSVAEALPLQMSPRRDHVIEHVGELPIREIPSLLLQSRSSILGVGLGILEEGLQPVEGGAELSLLARGEIF